MNVQESLKQSIDLEMLSNDEYQIEDGSNSQYVQSLKKEIATLEDQIKEKSKSYEKSKETMKSLEFLNRKFKTEKTNLTKLVTNARDELKMLIKRYEDNTQLANSLLKVVDTLKEKDRQPSSVFAIQETSKDGNSQQFQQKIEQLQADINTHRNLYRLALDEKEYIEKQYQHSQAQSVTLKEEKEYIEKQLQQTQTTYQAEIQRLRKQYEDKLRLSIINASVSENNSQSQENQELRQENQNLKKQIKLSEEFKMKNDIFKKKISEQTQQIQNLKKNLEEIDILKKIISDQAQKNENITHQDRNSEEIDILKDNVNKLNQQNESLMAQLQKCNSEMKNIIKMREQSFQEFQKQIAQKNQVVLEFSSKIRSLQAQKKTLLQKISALEQKIVIPFLDESEEEIKKLQSQISNFRALNQQIKQENVNLKLSLQNQTKEKMEKVMQLEKINKEYLKKAEEFDKLQQKCNDDIIKQYETDEQIKNLKQQNTKLNQKCVNLQAEITNLNNEIVNDTKCQELNKQLQKAIKQANSATVQANKLQKQISILNAQKQNIQIQFQDTQVERDSVKEELHKLKQFYEQKIAILEHEKQQLVKQPVSQIVSVVQSEGLDLIISQSEVFKQSQIFDPVTAPQSSNNLNQQQKFEFKLTEKLQQNTQKTQKTYNQKTQNYEEQLSLKAQLKSYSQKVNQLQSKIKALLEQKQKYELQSKQMKISHKKEIDQLSIKISNYIEQLKIAEEKAKNLETLKPEQIINKIQQISANMKVQAFFRFKNNVAFHFEQIETKKFAERP